MIGLFDIQNLSAGSNYDAVFVFPFNHIELESNEISIQVQSAFESVIDLNQTHTQVWDEYEDWQVMETERLCTERHKCNKYKHFQFCRSFAQKGQITLTVSLLH